MCDMFVFRSVQQQKNCRFQRCVSCVVGPQAFSNPHRNQMAGAHVREICLKHVRQQNAQSQLPIFSFLFLSLGTVQLLELEMFLHRLFWSQLIMALKCVGLVSVPAAALWLVCLLSCEPVRNFFLVFPILC